MVVHQEMDHRVPFGKQLAQQVEPVTLVNSFHVAPDDADAFVRAWQSDGEYMSGQPGYITTQLYRGIGGSTTFINVAVWESSSALRDALSDPEFQRRIGRYPTGTESSPHLFAKVAVPGVCDG